MVTSSPVDQLIHAVEAADSPARLVKAVQDLAAARLEAGIATLIAALGYNNPGAAVAAVDGLVQMGDVAVQPLLDLLDGYNYSARAWAIRALAQIRNPLALNTLLEAAENDFALSVRRAAVKGLGYLHWHLLPVDEVHSAQRRAAEVLLVVSQDPEWVVRYAVVVALQELARTIATDQPELHTHISNHLQQVLSTDLELVVQTRVRLALHQLSK